MKFFKNTLQNWNRFVGFIIFILLGVIVYVLYNAYTGKIVSDSLSIIIVIFIIPLFFLMIIAFYKMLRIEDYEFRAFLQKRSEADAIQIKALKLQLGLEKCQNRMNKRRIAYMKRLIVTQNENINLRTEMEERRQTIFFRELVLNLEKDDSYKSNQIVNEDEVEDFPDDKEKDINLSGEDIDEQEIAY